MSALETPKERLLRERDKQALIDGLALREDYRMTFSTPHGRRVLEDFLLGGHMLETTCSGNAWSYFYEGERNWALKLTAKIPGLVGEVMAKIMAERQDELNGVLAEAAPKEE